MKVKFETCFRFWMAFLVAVLIWSVWTDAQAAAATVTNAPVANSAPARHEAEMSTIFGSNMVFNLSFGLDGFEVLKPLLFGRPVWQYIASFIYILLALLAARVVDFLFQVSLKRLAARTETEYDDMLIELLHGPIKVVAFVIFLHVGLNMFTWPEWVEHYLSKGLTLVVAWSITVMAVRSVDVLMAFLKKRAVEEDRAFDAQLFPVISKSLKVFITLVALLVTAQNLSLNITGILASLSIGGLALGLAAQDTLANLFGAVAIFLDKPFKLGDRIKLESNDGTVEKIGLRSTRIRNVDGHLIAIPNKTMGSATITNVSQRPFIRTVMNLGVTYDTSTEKMQRALAILEEVYRRHPQTKDVWISFLTFADFSLNIQVIHWWNDTKDYKAYLDGMQAMNLEIKSRFEREGIEFAFPTQTHYVKPVA
jgi:MscS family membrane protein